MRRLGLTSLLTIVALSVATAASAVCSKTDTAHCLQGNRFKVEIDWLDYVGNGGKARTVANPTADSGLFWFYGADNWEVMVKVLNACHQNDRFWVFAAAATTLQYLITVTDTQTGAVKTYFNPLDVSSPATTDIEAFATCSGQPVPTPTATPVLANCPTNGPLNDLRKNCAHLIYFYQHGLVVAGLTSNGATAIGCFAAPTTDVICVRGPVLSAAAASLAQANVASGPFVPLDPGSLLEIHGNILDILMILEDEVFDLSGFQWFDTDATASSSVAMFFPGESSAIESAMRSRDLRESLRGLMHGLER